jgi:hypothetical protein
VVLATPLVAILLWPAALRWFKYPVLMRPASLQQAETAGAYVRALPPRTPVVFVMGYEGGRPGAYQAVVKERTIRIAMPPERQADLYFFVGEPADLLAGRRTPPPDARAGRITLPYWRAVRTILHGHPPAMVLQDTGRREFDASASLGARAIGPGVALLRGPSPTRPLMAAPSPDVAPSMPGGLGLALLILAILAVAGGGWTSVMAGGAAPVEMVCLAPVIGAGALVLGGFAAAVLGNGLRGGVGVAAAAGTAGGGYALAALTHRLPKR